MSRHSRISRRTILRGLGTAISLPLLEAMSGSQSIATAASAAVAQAPKRMAFLYVPNGIHMQDWTPKKTGKGFEITPIMQPIAKFKNKMNVLSGLTLNGARALGDGGGDHARSVAAYLTGAHPKKTSGSDIINGPSVDQVAAERIGNKTRLPSLELGMEASAPAGRCDSGYSCVYTSNMSWRTNTSPVAKEVNPASVFDRLFGDETNQNDSDRARARRERFRKSVLDFALEDANDLRRDLGIRDQRKLDEYLYAIREIEKRMKKADKLEGREEFVPDYPRPEGVPRDFEEHMKLLFDMLVLALQSDSTRIATFMFANAGSNRSYRNIEVSEGHHDLSHHGNKRQKQEKIAKINKYHVTLLNYFLTKMDSIKEGDSTLLDNSMIMYGSGIGDGNRHNHHDLPITLFGSCGGEIETGRHLKFKKETPLTNLYLTMLDKMGAEGVKQLGDSSGRLKI